MTPVAGQSSTPVRPGSRLTAGRCLELLNAQITSRHLDEAGRWLRSRGSGYYTIGSAGHEGNAPGAPPPLPPHPPLLHYRSGAFYLVRAGHAGRGGDGIAEGRLGRGAPPAAAIPGGPA